MAEFEFATYLPAAALAVLTVAASYLDTVKWRIPNSLNVAFFVLGLGTRTVLEGWGGLGDALLGFAVGFGVFFLLWLIGTAGGGDVKLIAAISVWLGLQQTLALLVLSTMMVIVLGITLAVVRKLRGGKSRVLQQYREEQQAKQRRRELTQQEKMMQKRQRSIMGWAVPVSIAVWILVLADVAGRLPSSLQ